jgi:hypothetical protein
MFVDEYRLHESWLFQHELRGYVDSSLDRSGHGTMFGVHVVYPFDGIPVGFVRLQMVDHVNAFNHEYIVFLFDLTGRLGPEIPVTGVNLTRFQRASKGSG